MTSSQDCTVIATYRVRAANEADFVALLRTHYPTLQRLGLVTAEPPVIYRGEEEGAPTYYEIFTWRDAEAPEVAHQTPDVMAIWEPMGALLESRDGRPEMEFPHVTRWDGSLEES